MRGFLTLLGKEWRDARPIVVASHLLAAGTVFLLPYAFRAESEYPAGAAQYIVPGLVALFVALVAADLVSVEAQTRRVAALALLPTRMSNVWAAKATLLALVSLAFIAWVSTCQIVALQVLRSEEAALDFTTRLSRETWQLGAFAAIGFATLFVSTLIERGFASFLLGLAAGVGAVAGAAYWMKSIADGFEPSREQVGLFGAVTATLFAVASLAAFTKGRIQTGVRLRRVVVGLVALAACVVPARGAAAAWMEWSWLAITPGDPSAWIAEMKPSPDGRWLALAVWKKDLARSQVVKAASAVWLIDVGDGSLRAAHGLLGLAWDADGRLIGYDGTPTELVERRLDPRTLAVVAEEPVTRAQYEARHSATPRWSSVTSELDKAAPKWCGGFRSKVTWTARHLTTPFDGQVYSFAEPGVVYHRASAFRLARRDMATGDDVTVLEDERGIGRVMFHSSGTRFLATIAGDDYLFDTATGRQLGGPWKRDSVSWPWGTVPSRYLQEPVDSYPKPMRYELIDIDAGRRIPVGSSTSNGWGWPQMLETPAGMFVLRADQNIDLLDTDGAVVRRLYSVHDSQGN